MAVDHGEVVIIGGGVMGLSAAYHLAQKGCSDIVLLEKHPLFGAGATGQNAGGIRHQFSTSVNIQLSKHGITMLTRFAEEIGQEIDLRMCGYLFLLDNEADLQQFERNVQRQRSFGIDTELLSPDEIRKKVPDFHVEDIVGGTFFAGDGIADPGGVVQGYVKAARNLGVRLLNDSRVTAIDVERDAIVAVHTDTDCFETGNVLIAAGPWAAEVGRMAGVELPVVPYRRQILVTRPIRQIAPDLPFVIDFSRALYFHYEGGGILTGMSNTMETPGFKTGIDEDWRLIHLENALRRLPILADAEIQAEWAGHYEVTPDNQPILGHLPSVRGLYACTGFSGHGFMHGPICGLLMAEEILDGKAHTLDIDSLRWDRFKDGLIDGEYNVV